MLKKDCGYINYIFEVRLQKTYFRIGHDTTICKHFKQQLEFLTTIIASLYKNITIPNQLI